jgi:hypothetical protein
LSERNHDCAQRHGLANLRRARLKHDVHALNSVEGLQDNPPRPYNRDRGAFAWQLELSRRFQNRYLQLVLQRVQIIIPLNVIGNELTERQCEVPTAGLTAKHLNLRNTRCVWIVAGWAALCGTK